MDVLKLIFYVVITAACLLIPYLIADTRFKKKDSKQTVRQYRWVILLISIFSLPLPYLLIPILKAFLHGTSGINDIFICSLLTIIEIISLFATYMLVIYFPDIKRWKYVLLLLLVLLHMLFIIGYMALLMMMMGDYFLKP